MMFVGLWCLFPRSPTDQETSEEIVPVENGGTAMNGKISTIAKPSHDKNQKVKNGKIHEEERTSDITLTVNQAILLAFKTRSFYILWLTMFFVDAGVHFAIGMNKAYGQTFIQDDHFLALVGSVGSVFNCIMRPVWVLILDRFGFKVAVRAMTFGVSLIVGTIVLTEHLHKAFYMIWTAGLFALFCGITTLGPSTLSKLFGPQNMAVNYGFIMSAVGCSTVVGGVTGTTLKETLGWHNMFFLSAGMIFLPFLTTFFFNGKDRDGKEI